MIILPCLWTTATCLLLSARYEYGFATPPLFHDSKVLFAPSSRPVESDGLYRHAHAPVMGALSH
jgi:hypothetical protein